MHICLAVVMSFVVAIPAWAGDDALLLYGRLDVGVDVADVSGQGRHTAMVDNNSHMGLITRDTLAPGLAAIGGLDWSILVDSGAGSTPAYRNSYVGLAGAYGTVVAGRLDFGVPTGAPAYTAMLNDISLVAHDGGATTVANFLNLRNRVSNAVGYMSPEFDGYTLRARYNRSTPQTDPGYLAGGPLPPRLGQSDLSLGYEGGPVTASLAYARDDRQGGPQPQDFRAKWQASGSYALPAVRLYAMAGDDRYQNTPATRSHVRYCLTGFSLPVSDLLQLTVNGMRRPLQNELRGGAANVQGGVVYFFSVRVRGFLVCDRMVADDHLPGGITRTVSTGLQYRF